MSEDSHEQLSAFMDGELGSEPARFMLRRLSQDAGMRGRWERYHLIREALRSGLPSSVDTGFAGRVYAGLGRAGEGRVRPHRGWPALVTRPLAGFAVAATVATVAVLGFQYVGQPGLAPVPGPSPVASRAPSASTGYRPTPVAETIAPRAAETARLNAYLVNHSEYATGAGIGGMLSYVRIVGYDPGSGAGQQ